MAETVTKRTHRFLIREAVSDHQHLRDVVPRLQPERDESDHDRQHHEFQFMRRVRQIATLERKWISLAASLTVWMMLWFLGAIAFWLPGQNEKLTYFEALYFSNTTLLPGYLASLTVTVPSGDPRPVDAPGQMPPPPPQAFLIGNLHTGLMVLLKKSGIYTDREPAPDIRIHRYDNPPYVKYLFQNVHVLSELEAGLPPGYRFKDRQGRTGILPHHYDLVRSWTHLPRSDETLSKIPGVAAFVDRPGEGEETPIALVFLDLDGSLATLFVEPEHRGKGIAEALSREVMRRGMAEGGIWREVGEEGKVWVHANVLATNEASRRVLEKLGGKVG